MHDHSSDHTRPSRFPNYYQTKSGVENSQSERQVAITQTSTRSTTYTSKDRRRKFNEK